MKTIAALNNANPFSLTFGIEPTNFIDRPQEKEKILSEFSTDEPSSSVCLLTGARGSGITFFMYSTANHLMQKDEWIVANIGPKIHMLEQLAAEIYNGGKTKLYFLLMNSHLHLKEIIFHYKAKNLFPTS